MNDDTQSWQYRAAHDPDSDSFVQRLHYQASTSANLLWRGVVQTRKTDTRNVDFDFFQGELFWQLADVQRGWHHGLRLDLRVRDGSHPNQVGLNWMHQFQIAPRWQARFLALTTRQMGSNWCSRRCDRRHRGP
ncbi:MAG: hypothetical protein AAF513_02940 [Pseudomonadota bacterium]